MACLYGRKLTRSQLLERVGDVSQVCRAVRARLSGGKSDGVEALQLSTGSGLNLMVLPGRGMDIFSVDYCGASLCWHSPTGVTAPAYYEPDGLGWLRSFYGGLMVTCGLTYAGAPSVDQGKALGLHGRVSNLPAENVSVDGQWDGDEYTVWVKGSVRETSVFGENVVLTRRISVRLGESRIFVDDTVENLGYESVEHMILYHVNLGYPVVSESSRLLTPSITVTPRDDEARDGAENYAAFDPPTRGYSEKVYYHDVGSSDEGGTKAALVNREFGNGQGLGVYIAYSRKELPVLVEWKMMGKGHYVVGLEPANCHVQGRRAERERGTLMYLEPGERRPYHLEIGVLTSIGEIDAVEKEIDRLRKG
jgi:hypothetical protein